MLMYVTLEVSAQFLAECDAITKTNSTLIGILVGIRTRQAI